MPNQATNAKQDLPVNQPCCGEGNSCSTPSQGRRDFLKASGLAAAMVAAGKSPAMAGPFTKEDFQHVVPADKKLSKQWIESLYARGEPLNATGDNLKFIGMPINGISTGQVYLGGDGRLWCWNLDGEPDAAWKDIGGGPKYMNPVQPSSPMDQGFAVEVGPADGKRVFALDSGGFGDIKFTNRYPMGRVNYSDADCPVDVQLDAYTPFVPLNRDDSSYPVIVMRYTIKNTSAQPQEVAIGGWIENFSNHRTAAVNANGVRLSQYRELEGLSIVECWARPRDEALNRQKKAEAEAALKQRTEQNAQSKKPPKDSSPDPNTIAFDWANDFGAVALGLQGDKKPDFVDTARSDAGPENLFQSGPPDESSKSLQESSLDDKAYASLGRRFTLQPGSEETVAFTLSWRFPNARFVTGFGRTVWSRDINFYSTQWPDASAAAHAVTTRETELRGTTQSWVDTWYDSTLPHWFLERTLIPIDCMQTQLTARLAMQDGMYGLDEGVNCCQGNCTHVWHYAQGLARLFPVIERECRDKVDFGRSFKSDTGAMNFRCSTKTFREATDGQCGTILRVFRESLMTTDLRFLQSIWDRTKLTMDYVIKTWDTNEDGLLSGAQHNTLDKAWYGQIHWLINLYHAALRATAKMAVQMNQPAVAARYEQLVAKGSASMVEMLWNEDFGYFVHIPELPPEKTIGSTTGCHIDQVLGEFWLRNLGLDPILPRDKVRKALSALWTYNFSPNIGDFRKHEKKGRWFAAEGEAGLIMCTFPHGKENAQKKNFHRYFNECMSGFEWQVAATMIWEGMLEEGLAIGKAIYDRYRPELRNPYNEVECGDHYSRALSSYSAFMAICGYRYDGPAGKLGFGPKMQQDNFRAAFTTADGWGSFSQTVADGVQAASVEIVYGRLTLNEFALDNVAGVAANVAEVKLDGQLIESTLEKATKSSTVKFTNPITITSGGKLQVRLR